MSKTNLPATPLAQFPLFLFAATSLVHLLGTLTHQTMLQSITKPFLILLLTVHFIFSVNLHFNRLNTGITIGLMFSFLGDTLLIFANSKPFFFLMGLLSFLCTHICYLFSFLSYPNARQGSVVQHPWRILPFVVFLVAYSALLFPNLANYLQIPVLLYSTVIIAMVNQHFESTKLDYTNVKLCIFIINS
ncbi:MAG: lysoplasmalogenase, partial [Saprospiraceae bacterium]|nr:lysoplasmalogenase [Saprospiraceae bacterium]